MSIRNELRIVLSSENGYSLLTLVGDLDYSASGGFRRELDSLLGQDPVLPLILDLAGLTCLDAAGLGLLISASKELKGTEAKLLLVTGEVTDELLQRTRLTDVFDCYSSLNEALAALNR